MKECEILKNESDLVWSNPDLTSQEKYFRTIELQEDFIERIKKRNLTKGSIYYIINNLSTKIQRKMLFTLYQTNPQEVKSILIQKRSKIEMVQKNSSGDIILYQKRFKKLQF